MASTYYDSAGKEVYDGDIAKAADLNTINVAVDTAFQAVESAIDTVNAEAEYWAGISQEWAITPEDTEITPGVYSSLHWAAKSSASALESAADAAAALADRILTNADVVLTHADAAQTALDRIATAADKLATNADVVLTHADVVLTHADAAQTALDRIATAADKVATNADAAQTALDRIATAADVVLTHADAAQTALDAIATAADRVQTGLDAAATAADRVQTGLDVIETDASAAEALASQLAAEAAEASAIAIVDVESGYPLVQPTLNLNFANTKTLDPRITFSRNSKETYTNDKGLLAYAEIDEPCFDHDPVTGECKGLAMWEARSNLLQYSESSTKGATIVGVDVYENSIVAPDGSLSGTTLKLNAINDYIYRAIDVTPETTYTLSQFIKLISASTATFAVYDTTNAAWILSATVIDGVTTEWGQHSVTFTTPAGCELIRIYPCRALTIDEVGTIGVFGLQLEAGAFPTPYMPSVQTFTSRASTGTYYGSDGLLKTAAIDEARMSYNPLALDIAPKMLLEGAATNFLTYSEDFFNAVWTKQRTTVVANQSIAPDGATTADKLVEDTATGIHYIYGGSISYVSGTTYTLSAYVKSTGSSRYLQLSFSAAVFGGLNADNAAVFDIDTGTVTAQGVDLEQVTIQPVSGGWYRCSITKTATATVSGAAYSILGLRNAPSIDLSTGYTGDGTSGLYIWATQLEAGQLSSYIPTTTAAVTRAADISSSAAASRAADIAAMTGSNFSDWYRQDEGSLLIGARSVGPGTTVYMLSINNGTSNERINLQTDTSGYALCTLYVGNINTVYNANGIIGSTLFNMSISYKLNYVASSRDGSAPIVDTSTVIPAVNRLSIGSSHANAAHLNGHIANLAYYPKAISDAELQTISA